MPDAAKLYFLSRVLLIHPVIHISSSVDTIIPFFPQRIQVCLHLHLRHITYNLVQYQSRIVPTRTTTRTGKHTPSSTTAH